MTDKRYAVLIASSDFPDEPGLQPLTLPERDVDGVRDVLAAPELGGFTDVVVIKNRPHHEALKAINRALKQAEQDDLVLIYYSGHGKLDGAGRLYLATLDTELAVLESTAIAVHAIRALIDVGQASRTALILDCCYSGAVDQAFRGSVDEQLHQISGGRGTYIMTASTGIQTAQEKEGDDYGLFTKHVINGIRSGEADRDGDGYITMSELYNYVHDNVLREGAQEPMRWTLNVRGELVVARSGKATREERRQEIRNLLFDLSREGVLPDRVLRSALEVLSVPLPALTGAARRQDALLTQLAERSIRIGDFVDRWLDLAQDRPAEPAQEAAEPADVEPEPERPRDTEKAAGPDPEQGSSDAAPGARAAVERWLDRLNPLLRNIGIPVAWLVACYLVLVLMWALAQSELGFIYGALLVAGAAVVLFRMFAGHFAVIGKLLFVAATGVIVAAGLITGEAVRF